MITEEIVMLLHITGDPWTDKLSAGLLFMRGFSLTLTHAKYADEVRRTPR